MHHPPWLTKPHPHHLSSGAMDPKFNQGKEFGPSFLYSAKLRPHIEILSGTKWAFYLADEDNYFMFCGYA